MSSEISDMFEVTYYPKFLPSIEKEDFIKRVVNPLGGKFYGSYPLDGKIFSKHILYIHGISGSLALQEVDLYRNSGGKKMKFITSKKSVFDYIKKEYFDYLERREESRI